MGFVVFQIAGAAHGQPARPAGEPTPLAGLARDLLLEPCGSCHRSSLPTAKPRALLIFDLDEAAWDRRMTGDQVRELARRLRASAKLNPADSAVLDDYLQARLGPPPS